MGCYARVYITKAQNDILAHFAVMCFLNKKAEEIKKVPEGYTFRHFVNLENFNYRLVTVKLIYLLYQIILNNASSFTELI